MSSDGSLLYSSYTNEDQVKASWTVGNPLFIVVFYILTYASTAVPSFAGLIPIYFFKTCILVMLVFDAIYQYVTLKFHTVSEAYIWTSKNWGANCFRRILIEILINFLYILTQQLPAVNWISNLIPLGLSLYNLTSISTQ